MDLVERTDVPDAQPGDAGGLAVEPSMHDFGLVDVGIAPAPTRSFAVRNASARAVNLELLLDGPDASDFRLLPGSSCSDSLPADGSCMTVVAFSPGERGPRRAFVKLQGAAGTTSVPLSGTGRDFVDLDVIVSGAGSGAVTSSPGSIDCRTGGSSNCAQRVERVGAPDPVVVLTPSPIGRSAFTGWSGGGCSGTAACSVTMDQSKSVTATFAPAHVLTFSLKLVGQGASSTVTSSPPGLGCTSNCNVAVNFPVNASVTVNPGAIGMLHQFAGDCTGATCSVAMTQDRAVSLTVSAYNYAFVTSTTYTGDFGNADALCAARAAAAGLPGSYKAWLSRLGENARDRFPSSRGWQRVDGLPVADSVADLVTKSKILYPISMTELGTRLLGHAWTGQLGAALNFHCNDWTSAASVDLGTKGRSDSGPGAWLYDGNFPCDTQASLYCMGTDLNRPLAYPPAVGRKAFVSLPWQITVGGGVGSADALCQADATAASLASATKFKALLATVGKSAASRFNLGGAAWVRTDGVRLAATPTDFMVTAPGEPGLTAPLAVLADGKTYVATLARTGGGGLPTSVGVASDTCVDWSDPAPSVSTLAGATGAGHYGAFFNTVVACAGVVRVYCLED